jgi:peptidoglycan/xylan/chitin deacetylase (PgdA/CDA1 family)
MISVLIKRAKDSLKYRIGKIIPSAVVLLYHRVAPSTEDDPQLLTVTVEHFKEHLQVLRNYYNPSSISRLAAGAGCGWIVNRSVAVTFDDGYLDNLMYAAPLLEDLKIPAEVYVVSSAVNENLEFYWDVLQRVMRCGQDWNVEIPPDTPARKQYVEECEKIKFMNPCERTKYITEILENARTGENYNCQEWRVMNVNELKKLSVFKMISIGAHTVNHPVLAVLPPETQQKEIECSKNNLQFCIMT